jgi:hypothetical protein
VLFGIGYIEAAATYNSILAISCLSPFYLKIGISDLCPSSGASSPRRARNVTEEYERGTEIVLELVERFGIRRAYLLKDSPACGRGYGITAKRLEAAGVTVGVEETKKLIVKFYLSMV